MGDLENGGTEEETWLRNSSGGVTVASDAAVFLRHGKDESMGKCTDIDIVVLIREHLQLASRTMEMHDEYVAVQRSSSVVAS